MEGWDVRGKRSSTNKWKKRIYGIVQKWEKAWIRYRTLPDRR